RLRHLQQAPGDHRVGVSGPPLGGNANVVSGVHPPFGRDRVRLKLVATGLFVCVGCSHAPPPSEEKKVERRDDWLLALKSDLELTASNDGFQGRVRVVHAGKAEVDRSFGDTSCLPLGPGRRLLATVAVGFLVQDGRLGWDDWVERRLPSAANTSFSALTL